MLYIARPVKAEPPTDPADEPQLCPPPGGVLSAVAGRIAEAEVPELL
jgi:hypothetical protein